MTITSRISRRNFIKFSGLSGVALTLGFYVPSSGKGVAVMKPEDAAHEGIELNAWISVDKSGKVTIINHRSEMGQGSFQSVPQIIAEELEVDLNDVNIEFAKGSQTLYGSQVTGGSSTIRGSYKKLLQLSATAREMLIDAAAKNGMSVKRSVMPRRGRSFINHPAKNTIMVIWLKRPQKQRPQQMSN